MIISIKQQNISYESLLWKIDFTPGTNYDFIFLVDKESDEDFIRKQEQLFAHFNFCFNIGKYRKMNQ